MLTLMHKIYGPGDLHKTASTLQVHEWSEERANSCASWGEAAVIRLLNNGESVARTTSHRNTLTPLQHCCRSFSWLWPQRAASQLRLDFFFSRIDGTMYVTVPQWCFTTMHLNKHILFFSSLNQLATTVSVTAT